MYSPSGKPLTSKFWSYYGRGNRSQSWRFYSSHAEAWYGCRITIASSIICLLLFIFPRKYQQRHKSLFRSRGVPVLEFWVSQVFLTQYRLKYEKTSNQRSSFSETKVKQSIKQTLAKMNDCKIWLHIVLVRGVCKNVDVLLFQGVTGIESNKPCFELNWSVESQKYCL